MRLTESMFHKNIEMRVQDPYSVSLEMMKRVSGFAKVNEKRNNYMTDGPRHMSEVMFDAEQEIDEHTKIKISFELRGEESRLFINVEGAIIASVIKYGFMSDIFSDYYIKNVYHDIKRDAESRNSLVKQVIKLLDTI